MSIIIVIIVIIVTITIMIIIVMHLDVGRGQVGSALMGSLLIMFNVFDRGNFGLLRLIYFMFPKVTAGRTFFPNLSKFTTFAAAL